MQGKRCLICIKVRKIVNIESNEKAPLFTEGLLWAKDEIRTRDPDLGKVVLYQLSYFRVGIVVLLYSERESNPHDF